MCYSAGEAKEGGDRGPGGIWGVMWGLAETLGGHPLGSEQTSGEEPGPGVAAGMQGVGQRGCLGSGPGAHRSPLDCPGSRRPSPTPVSSWSQLKQSQASHKLPRPQGSRRGQLGAAGVALLRPGIPPRPSGSSVGVLTSPGCRASLWPFPDTMLGQGAVSSALPSLPSHCRGGQIPNRHPACQSRNLPGWPGRPCVSDHWGQEALTSVAGQPFPTL